MRSLFKKLRCRIGMHQQLDVIQTFGSAQRIGCPDCGKTFGIHHGVRACIPWDAELEDMYRMFGHDTTAPFSRWDAYRKRRSADA